MLPKAIEQALSNGGIILDDQNTVRLHIDRDYSIWFQTGYILRRGALYYLVVIRFKLWKDFTR